MAWRIAHLSDCYGADRNGTFLGAALAPVVLDPDGTVHRAWVTHQSGSFGVVAAAQNDPGTMCSGVPGAE
jgi:hypothetical protein